MKAGIWAFLTPVAVLSAGLASWIIWTLLVEPQRLMAWSW